MKKIEKMQVKRFNKLFNYAKTHSRFYSDLYKENGVYDLKIKSFNEIEKIPLIDKYSFKRYSYNDILTSKDNINEHTTSGSSGEPFKVYFNKYEDYTAHVRVFYILRKVAKYTPLKKISMVTRYEPNESFQVEGDLSIIKQVQKKLGLFRREIISIYEKPSDIIGKLSKSKPYILWSTPSIMEIVVNTMIREGVKLDIPFLFLTSESLSDNQIEKFHKNLSKNVVDIYGSMESPCLGYDINKSGKRIIFPSSNIFEFSNKRDSEIGSIGDVTITNLINFTMPIIRYNLKDIGEISEDIKFPLKYINNIIGRIDDIIYFSDGGELAHHHVAEMFMDFSECEQYKFIQKKDGQIILQLRPNIHFSEDEIRKKARERWNKRFPKKQIDIKFVEYFSIDKKTGKFKNIEKEI